MSPTVVIRLISWLCVVMRGYILHMYRKGAITLRWWFYVVIRSKSWLYTQFMVIRLVVLMMLQQRARKIHEWLCVSDCGYTSHIVVMRGYTWLYAACVPKRPQNHIVTVNVVRPLLQRQSTSLVLYCYIHNLNVFLFLFQDTLHIHIKHHRANIYGD